MLLQFYDLVKLWRLLGVGISENRRRMFQLGLTQTPDDIESLCSLQLM